MPKSALPRTAAYAASKFALIGLTQAAALDLALAQAGSTLANETQTKVFNERRLGARRRRGRCLTDIGVRDGRRLPEGLAIEDDLVT